MNPVKHLRSEARRTAIAALLLSVLGGMPSSAVARMYQWVDPVTHSVQLSGTPPAWYRADDGPRVLVYERGRVIDDTARPVEPARRAELRARAFGENQPALLNPAPSAPAPESSPAQPKTEVPPAVAQKSDQLETFKALLEAWDREHAAAATRAITPASPTPPSP